MLLPRTTGCVSIDNFSTFNVIWQQSARNCKRRDRRPTAVDIVTNGNEASFPWQHIILRPKLRNQTSLVPYSTDNRSICSNSRRCNRDLWCMQSQHDSRKWFWLVNTYTDACHAVRSGKTAKRSLRQAFLCQVFPPPPTQRVRKA